MNSIDLHSPITAIQGTLQRIQQVIYESKSNTREDDRSFKFFSSSLISGKMVAGYNLETQVPSVDRFGMPIKSEKISVMALANEIIADCPEVMEEIINAFPQAVEPTNHAEILEAINASKKIIQSGDKAEEVVEDEITTLIKHNAEMFHPEWHDAILLTLAVEEEFAEKEFFDHIAPLRMEEEKMLAALIRTEDEAFGNTVQEYLTQEQAFYLEQAAADNQKFIDYIAPLRIAEEQEFLACLRTEDEFFLQDAQNHQRLEQEYHQEKIAEDELFAYMAANFNETDETSALIKYEDPNADVTAVKPVPEIKTSKPAERRKTLAQLKAAQLDLFSSDRNDLPQPESSTAELAKELSSEVAKPSVVDLLSQEMLDKLYEKDSKDDYTYGRN